MLRFWDEAIGEAFLSYHGLGDAGSCYALHGPDAERIQAATGARAVHTACRDPAMPYPIIVGCAMPPGDPRVYYSYEFTPQYSGVPAAIGDALPLPLGGVLIEAFAASSSPPAAPRPADAPPVDRVRCALCLRRVVPLAQAAGISSGYLAQHFARAARGPGPWALMGCAEMAYWDGLGGGGRDLGFCDGAGTDNYALLPALRRGVRALLVCVALSARPPPPGPPGDAAADADAADAFAAEHPDLAAYFGRIPPGQGPRHGGGAVGAGEHNASVCVFEPDAFDALAGRLRALEAAGEALVVRLRLRVVANATQGVAGGRAVETVWVFNGGAARWRAALPAEARRAAEAIPGFPYLPTAKLAYSRREATCLSQLAAWSVHQAAAPIRAMLRAPKPPRGGAPAPAPTAPAAPPDSDLAVGRSGDGWPPQREASQPPAPSGPVDGTADRQPAGGPMPHESGR